MSLPSINGRRLNETLQYSCQWGCTPDGGMNRVALNDDDAKVKRWFISEVEKMGCKVTIDQLGNIFAVRPGQNPAIAPIAIGSHLDTQATGGRYDGILGVLTGLEIMRACHDTGYRTFAPLALVVWTNEEGCRFAPYAIGSGVWAGVYDVDFGHACADVAGVTLGSELDRHGFLAGAQTCSFEAQPLSAHFEVHIEQGPILCYSDTPSPIATVTGAAGLRWYDIHLKGIGAHAGTTPMNMRKGKDAVIYMAHIILETERIAVELGGQATNGRIGSGGAPQAYNCILGDVELGLDLRHKDEGQLDVLAHRVRSSCEKIALEYGVEIVKWKEVLRSPAIKFAEEAVEAVRNACARTKHPRFELISGAGHDSCYTNLKCPTAMLFVRCKDGLSHTPLEYASPEDIEEGAKVLLDAVLTYDKTKNA